MIAKVSRNIMIRLFPELKSIETTRLLRVEKVNKDVLTSEEEYFDYLIIRKEEQPFMISAPFYVNLLTEDGEIDADSVVLLIKHPHEDSKMTRVYICTHLKEILQAIVEEEIQAVRKLLE